MSLTALQKNALSDFKYRHLNYNMLKDALEIYDAVEIYKEASSSCCAFWCFKDNNLPEVEAMQQIKQVLDFQCPGWENSQATNLYETHCRLSLALQSIFSRRLSRGSRSSRNPLSNSSQIIKAIESAKGFSSQKKLKKKGALDYLSDYFGGDVSSRYSDIQKIKETIIAIKCGISSVEISSDWKKEALITLNGIISFCDDFKYIKAAYADVKRNKPRVIFDSGAIMESKGGYLLYHSPGLEESEGVAYHLEGYKNFDAFTNSITCIFHQVITAYDIASSKGDEAGFYSSLYGGYCIDARTDKIIKAYLRPDKFCLPFTELVKDSYEQTSAFFELSGVEDNLKNMSEYLFSCYKGFKCLDDVHHSTEPVQTKVTKKLIVDFLVDTMQIYDRAPRARHGSCICSCFSSCCFFGSSRSKSRVQAQNLLPDGNFRIQR